MRKYIRIRPIYFVSLLSFRKITQPPFQRRMVTFIQQHTALSLLASLSIVILLVHYFLVPAQNSVLRLAKSQFLSQQICVSCSSSNNFSSTKSRNTLQQPFIFSPGLALPRNTSATTSNPFSTSDGISTVNTQTLLPARGSLNIFPYGSCTWWANQRYFQLHGYYVPWRIQSDAWQWTNRAREFGWYVSNYPVLGAIIDLQPGVQGASWLGHVAVVERILSNGDVIASNMNWGIYPWRVTYVTFVPGPGVTFLYLPNTIPSNSAPK